MDETIESRLADCEHNIGRLICQNHALQTLVVCLLHQHQSPHRVLKAYDQWIELTHNSALFETDVSDAMREAITAHGKRFAEILKKSIPLG